MSEQLRPPSVKFEKKIEPDIEIESRRIEDIILQLADVAIRLSRTYRVPRYDTYTRENDAEHSVMVALQAATIAAEFRPDLNPFEVGFRAIIHELIEIIVKDVQTFNITDDELARKSQREDEAVEQLCSTLPSFIANLVREYQEHSDPASRFVGMVDKISPVAVDILGPGTKIMHEDYGTRTLPELKSTHNQLQRRYDSRYPEPSLDPLRLAQKSLMRKFERLFEPPESYYEGPEYAI